MYYYKIHESRAGYLIAACDKSVCGKTLKQGDLEFYVNPRFYKEKEASEAQLKKLFACSTSANIVGKKIVKFAIEIGLIDKSGVINIDGIPHAQMVVMNM